MERQPAESSVGPPPEWEVRMGYVLFIAVAVLLFVGDHVVRKARLSREAKHRTLDA